MTPDQEGSFTIKYPEKTMRIYEASLEYKKENKDLIVLARKLWLWIFKRCSC